MGRPTKNAFHGGGRRGVDMSLSPQAAIQANGPMTPDAYRAMKAAKAAKTAQRKQERSAANKPKQKR